jgi:hypothetical protein
VNKRMTYNGTMAPSTRDDVVDLWRQAVLGDASARRSFLLRIMPQSEMPAAPVIEFDSRAGRRRRDRAA